MKTRLSLAYRSAYETVILFATHFFFSSFPFGQHAAISKGILTQFDCARNKPSSLQKTTSSNSFEKGVLAISQEPKKQGRKEERWKRTVFERKESRKNITRCNIINVVNAQEMQKRINLQRWNEMKKRKKKSKNTGIPYCNQLNQKKMLCLSKWIFIYFFSFASLTKHFFYHLLMVQVFFSLADADVYPEYELWL